MDAVTAAAVGKIPVSADGDTISPMPWTPRARPNIVEGTYDIERIDRTGSEYFEGTRRAKPQRIFQRF
jgi:hypothetical protein